MRRDGRTSRTGILLIVVAVAVAGCSSDDDGLPEGLRDVSELDPVGADANGSVDDAVPDGSQPGEPEVGEPEVDLDEEPDSEPGDALEGDDGVVTVSGVVVPDSAFQINPDLDLDPDQQRELLQFSLDAYLYTTTALNTGEWDPDELAAYHAGEALTDTIQGLEEYRRDGIRQVNDGTVVEYLRLEAFDGGGATVYRCTRDGPNDGAIDIETGEYTYRPDEPYWPVALRLALVVDDHDRPGWRIIDGGGSSNVPCPE